MDEDREEMSLKEQIDWYLDRIHDKRMLKMILNFINRIFVGGKW